MAEGALFFIQSPILSPFSADGDVAGLPCYSLGLRYWNSDDERTPPPQAVPRPFTGVTCYTVLQTGILRKDDHATRCFEPTEMNMFTRWNQMTRHYSSSSIGYAA